MAIATGINEIFVSYGEMDDPIYFRNFRKFKKIVPLDGGWITHVFYEITKFPMGRSETEIWLNKNYGNPKYSNNWWTTYNGICMNEKIYTHYKLME